MPQAIRVQRAKQHLSIQVEFNLARAELRVRLAIVARKIRGRNHRLRAGLVGVGHITQYLPLERAGLHRYRDFAAHPFALELAYLRSFRAADIAKRSLQEMRRAGTFDAAQAQRWQSALQRVLPDVKPGDRLVGINRPGQGLAFVLNGKPQGEIADPQLAALFFAIWLGDKTSEPAMRQALLAGTPP